MGELLVREATRADLPAIVRMLAADAIRGGLGNAPADDVPAYDLPADDLPSDDETTAPEYVAAFDEIAADPNVLLLAGELDGDVVATCQLTFLRHLIYRGALFAQVESVRTVSHLRGQGIGRSLMEWVIEESRRRGALRVQLTSNLQREDAHRFYQRLGFEGSHLGMKLSLQERA